MHPFDRAAGFAVLLLLPLAACASTQEPRPTDAALAEAVHDQHEFAKLVGDGLRRDQPDTELTYDREQFAWRFGAGDGARVIYLANAWAEYRRGSPAERQAVLDRWVRFAREVQTEKPETFEVASPDVVFTVRPSSVLDQLASVGDVTRFDRRAPVHVRLNAALILMAVVSRQVVYERCSLVAVSISYAASMATLMVWGSV